MLQIILASSVALLGTLGIFISHLPIMALISKLVTVVGVIWTGYSTFKKIQCVIRIFKLTKAANAAIKAKIDEHKKQ